MKKIYWYSTIVFDLYNHQKKKKREREKEAKDGMEGGRQRKREKCGWGKREGQRMFKHA